MCTYRSRASLEARFARAEAEAGGFAVEGWLHHHGRALVDRFDANTYVTLTQAMDTHDVGRGRGGWREALATVRVPALVVSIDTRRALPAGRAGGAGGARCPARGWRRSPRPTGTTRS